MISGLIFAICGKMIHIQPLGVYLGRRKSLHLPLQPLISALLAFPVDRVCPVATLMVRHSSFWCSEKKIMTILNLYFSAVILA